jgi:hypothetical protein
MACRREDDYQKSKYTEMRSTDLHFNDKLAQQDTGSSSSETIGFQSVEFLLGLACQVAFSDPNINHIILTQIDFFGLV